MVAMEMGKENYFTTTAKVGNREKCFIKDMSLINSNYN